MQILFSARSLSFCSFYFKDHVITRYKNVPRNFSGPDEHDQHPNTPSIKLLVTDLVHLTNKSPSL